MDIPLLSMALSNSNVQSQVNLSLMKKVMDTSAANATSLTKMLESTNVSGQAPHPYLGGKVDIKL